MTRVAELTVYGVASWLPPLVRQVAVRDSTVMAARERQARRFAGTALMCNGDMAWAMCGRTVRLLMKAAMNPAGAASGGAAPAVGRRGRRRKRTHYEAEVKWDRA